MKTLPRQRGEGGDGGEREGPTDFRNGERGGKFTGKSAGRRSRKRRMRKEVIGTGQMKVPWQAK